MPSEEIDFAFADLEKSRRDGSPRSFVHDEGFAPQPQPIRAIAAPVGRTLPASTDAEEMVLSATFIDAADTFARCEQAKLTAGDFYEQKHETVFACAIDLHKRGIEVATWTVAEELKRTRQLESVGGLAFITQVSARAPTTAQAGYFIEKVREQAMLREIIRTATSAVEDCYGFSGGITEFAAEIEAKITNVTKRAQGSSTWSARPLTEFALPPAEDPAILLGKYRYLCRGGALVLVGSSGTGKSSSALQMAVCWALGRDFLGITCAKPLRSIIVEAEDDEGDVAEVWTSICAAMKLTEEEIALVKSRVLIVEDRITSGAEFLAELKAGAARWKPDLVFINPLLSFAGCAISEQEQMSAFLRNGLNRVNADKKWAYIVVHHTNKPPTQKEGASRNWNEWMYNMAGSAELPNWARAVITIEAKKTEGQFIFRLAKRGKRAGVVKEVMADPDAGEGACRVEVVTKIHAQHSTRKIQLEDGRSLQMMVWEPGEESSEENAVEQPKPRATEAPRGRKPKNTFDDFKGLWPVGEENAAPFGEIKRRLCVKDSISDGALGRLLKEAMADGKLQFRLDPDKRKAGYYVPL